MLKKIFSILLFLVLINLVNANGLNIINNSMDLNKSYGTDKTFELTIRNEESFAFSNITFQENWITTPKFSLNSGENITITAKITNNNDFNGQVTLIGDYYTNIGASNLTQNVEISWDNSWLSPCNLNLIAGDSIKWNNTHYDSIKLINSDTNGEIATIQAQSSLIKTFNSPIVFNYYASWIGSRFTQICNVNVMNSEGYVHNSIYDGILNLKLKILFQETTIESTFYEDSYNISYGNSIEDIFKLKTTGSQISRNIKLSGDWFSFDENNFDLSPGVSKNIGLTISPLIYSTNQTNKTYQKIIKIEGNFGTIEKNISIFVPYRNLDSMFSGNIDEDVIYNFFKSFCEDDYDACVGLFCAVYPEECESGSLRDSNVTQSFSGSSIKELIEKYAGLSKENENSKKAQIEVDTTQTNAVIDLGIKYNESNTKLDTLNENYKTLATSILFSIITLFSLISGVVLYVLVFKVGSVDIIKKRLNFHKGERL